MPNKVGLANSIEIGVKLTSILIVNFKPNTF